MTAVRPGCLTLFPGLADVLVIGGQGRLQPMRPAKPLEPRRRLGVVQVGMVTTAGADELEHIGIAALEAAVYDADRLPPHECGPAMTVLAGRRKRHDVLGLDAQPGVTVAGRAQPGHLGRMRGRLVSVHDYRVYGTAHSTHRRQWFLPPPDPAAAESVYHETIRGRRNVANARPGQIVPGHPIFRCCFLCV